MTKIRSKGYTFDDVLIVPKYSEVRSRTNVDLSVQLGKHHLKMPLIAANMDTVCGPRMASAMDSLGSFGVMHRNIPLVSSGDPLTNTRFGSVAGRTIRSAVAFGVNDDLDIVIQQANSWRTQILVLDIAHGHSKHALKALEYVISEIDHEATFIGGNVATAQAVEDFAKIGADVVKVGIGPGSVCSTRVVAGVGVPQLTAIEECSAVADAVGIQTIADGGIKTPGDAAKALAAGADAVMIGGMFAGTDEAPGKKITLEDGTVVKEHRGMASAEAGSSFPEGVSGTVVSKGPVADVVESINRGIRSACSYVGAGSLAELYERSEFVEISPAGLRESAPHDILNANLW
jgi:IMP dehydrogenase